MKKIRIKKRTERLTEISFAKAALETHRCPYLRSDSIGFYCAKDLKLGEKIDDDRRVICDASSRLAWCSSEQKYEECTFYNRGMVL